MAVRSSSPVARQHHHHSRTYFLPRRPVGWWAVALLLAAGLFAAGWGAVENVLHNNWLQIVLAIALGVTAFGVGTAAIVKSHDRSIVLSLLLAVVAFEVLLGLLFGVALLLSAS